MKKLQIYIKSNPDFAALLIICGSGIVVCLAMAIVTYYNN